MFEDLLRDHVTLQQAVLTSDVAGGQDEDWTNRLTRPARVSSVSGRQAAMYAREGHVNVERISIDDAIPRTRGKTSLRELLYAPGETQFRFVFRGRTLTIVAVIQPSHGLHDTMGNVVFIDCVEAPFPMGHLDG